MSLEDDPFDGLADTFNVLEQRQQEVVDKLNKYGGLAELLENEPSAFVNFSDDRINELLEYYPSTHKELVTFLYNYYGIYFYDTE